MVYEQQIDRLEFPSEGKQIFWAVNVVPCVFDTVCEQHVNDSTVFSCFDDDFHNVSTKRDSPRPSFLFDRVFEKKFWMVASKNLPHNRFIKGRMRS